ncbi:PPK2 family polyphosphate kinase [Aureitalea marina]|uniref:Phosphate--nucleotide phosphotransferase n=1 Tax=Aureitalea marina TaxID=930804 RepID=A0A2S7KMI3_9FLAO|nr:PPK2 family polyphosphate kinase [Aureitalea marina]PQB03837.1 phosphate--nucleotide phosphotransferase [Aureitalea marina]
MKKLDPTRFKAKVPVNLAKTPTHVEHNRSEKVMEKMLEETREELGDLQNTLYAHGKYSVLVCIQGMDTAGKDSLIREVFKDFNVRGVEVHSFKVPTELERRHDYLWRHYLALPRRGTFGVFNRTHYENVLVTRVHPEYILGELLPDINDVSDIDETFWDNRFEQIRGFEKTIAQNGTIIFKFFLHLSKDEQKHRLLRRLRKKNKQWKFSPGDLKERMLWDDYQRCYQDAINRTSEEHAPWYLIPADDKPTARYLIAKILLETMKTYDDIVEPPLDPDVMAHIDQYREQLEKE